MKTAVEIYRLLPKTNCGKCGTVSCFGFAAKVATRQAEPRDCPTMSEAARGELGSLAAEETVVSGTMFEQTLVSLLPKVGALDFGKTARLFGAILKGPDLLEITFLNEIYSVSREKVLDLSGSEPQPWISILIYNHLCMPDPPPLSREWITFSSVPSSHAKDKAWVAHVEDLESVGSS